MDGEREYHLEVFFRLGDKAIESHPKSITFLEEGGYIRKCEVELSSINALFSRMEARRLGHPDPVDSVSSGVQDHYVWTASGNRILRQTGLSA